MWDMSRIMLTLIYVFMLLGLVNCIDSGVDGCQVNCEAFDRLQGPTRMLQTRPHPWSVANYPTRQPGFCKLGCQYFFSEFPELAKCKAECKSIYRYRVSAGYSDAAEEAILNCEDGCDIAIQVCQSGFFCKNGTSSQITMTGLLNDRSVMCYRDAGNSGGTTCNIVTRSGGVEGVSGLSKGRPIVVNNVNNGPTDYLSVAYLKPKSKAIICFRDYRGTWIPSENGKGRCIEIFDQSIKLPEFADYVTAPLNSMSTGEGLDFKELFFNLRPTEQISVTDIGGDAIVCFLDVGGGSVGSCSTVVPDPLTKSLKVGGVAIFSQGGVDSIFTASLGVDAAIACYGDLQNATVACSTLYAPGDSSAGTLAISLTSQTSIDSFQGTQVRVKIMDENNEFGLVCYRRVINGYLYCTAIGIGPAPNFAITYGTPVPVFMNATDYIDLTIMSNTTSVVCYKNVYPNIAQCQLITVRHSTLTVTVPVDAPTVFSDVETDNIAVQKLTETLSLVCYQNTYRAGKGMCTEIEWAGTGTSSLEVTNSLIINDDMMLPCPAGRYREPTQGDLVRDCINCPAGRYRFRDKGKSAEGCLTCPKGKYAAVTGSVQVSDCLRCPAGTTAEEEGMGSCKCITERSCNFVLNQNGIYKTYYKPADVSGDPDVVDYWRESVPYLGRS